MLCGSAHVKKKTLTYLAKLAVENKSCFSCLQGCTSPWYEGARAYKGVYLHEAERVYRSRSNDKTASHASPLTGQTGTKWGSDKANTNAGRKFFSKSIPNSS